ncbi:hypothetical protein [Polynucleobacter sp. UB-Piko-W3]|uniref:hypothetical protein n=1 Tax=Polynucleobacter sp. UB-Piko-W3 TaxID=1819735 RepID=UPI001C0B3380|nr:hypothetical protein [Polynucleobacter sp. UB-Piko-W3]MBU3554858.1 hypothetical protein [Polynucleobacter sp. UB-Piko-W3]
MKNLVRDDLEFRKRLAFVRQAQQDKRDQRFFKWVILLTVLYVLAHLFHFLWKG